MVKLLIFRKVNEMEPDCEASPPQNDKILLKYVAYFVTILNSFLIGHVKITYLRILFDNGNN